jgi:hypothetical protein
MATSSNIYCHMCWKEIWLSYLRTQVKSCLPCSIIIIFFNLVIFSLERNLH